MARACCAANLREFFAPIEAPVYKGFDAWQGADVAIATGWQTVHPALLLDQCRARASTSSTTTSPSSTRPRSSGCSPQDTYRQGLHCIAASPWLRDLLIERYGASADAFQLGVEHDTYRPRPVARRKDTVDLLRAPRHPAARGADRADGARELHRRRPEMRIVLFGDRQAAATRPSPTSTSACSPRRSSRGCTRRPPSGLCLSLTNFSLMPKEMLACGLPCVELAGVSAESIFGADGAARARPAGPAAIADALERLLDDPALRERRSREGIEFVASHTWEHATDEVEAGLRHALRERETRGSEATPTSARERPRTPPGAGNRSPGYV